MEKRGWKIYFHNLFNDKYEELYESVLALRKRNPTGYKKNPRTKLLASVHKAITVDVPENPLHPKFNLGYALGPKYKSWKRVKSGMPERYRLFFKYNTSEKSIVFAWLNDEYSLRKAGDKHDVYRVFERLLECGNIPSEFSALLSSSKCRSEF